MLFPDVDTPNVLIDVDIATRNIEAYQAYCTKHGISFRPHIKTHKLPRFAKQQIAAGAVGITCQKIGEAEVMADAGVDDILLTYNILGAPKLKRLVALAQRISLRVVADNSTVIQGLSKAFANEDTPLPVLVECDTGAARCGVASPSQAADLAAEIAAAPGLHFQGLMTFPAVGGTAQVQSWMSDAIEKCAGKGLSCETISSGGTPDMLHAHEAPVVTEYRIGTYIYNDKSLLERDACGFDDCALVVLVTVVSTPDGNRAIIDAGSKVLTSDLFGLEGHGAVVGRPDLQIYTLSEEHGVLRSDNDSTNLVVGERLQIIPNHCCVVTNMMNSVILHHSGENLSECPVAARGLVR